MDSARCFELSMIINIVLTGFIAMIFLTLLMGVPYTLNVIWLPQIVKDVYCYGKASRDRVLGRLATAIRVPKRWFSHFYWFACTYMCLVLFILVRSLVFHNKPPEALVWYLNWTAFHQHQDIITPELTLVLAVLFLIQLSRRLYEVLHIHEFSDASMNVLHYLVGLYHYWGCCTVILAYAANWNNLEVEIVHFNWKSFGLQQFIGIISFVYASFQQHKAHKQLATYRRKPGNRERYFLPRGGLFEYVSCPNFLCEILIYLSLYIVAGFSHYPWALIAVWVSINQVLSASMAHQWYQTHFKDYPKARKAVIPFVY